MQKRVATSLIKLSTSLRRICRGRLATQAAISDATGVPQSTVSKALHGRLKRETAGTRSLSHYADILLTDGAQSDVDRAISHFRKAGGTEAELVRLLSAATVLLGRQTD